MASNKQIEDFVATIQTFMNFKSQTPFSAVANALAEYEKSKWIAFDETRFPQELIRQEIQVRVELDYGEEVEYYVTFARYTGSYWLLAAHTSDYVEGIVTHYQPMAEIDVKS